MKSTVVTTLLALGLLATNLLITNTFFELQISKVHATDVAKIAAEISPSPNPSPSPSPTPSPSPSPVYTGFCQNVPILMYHHIQPMEQAKEKNQGFITVDPQTFDTQMGYLKSAGYQTISLDQLTNALINHQSLPSKSIVITIDDGYRDIHTHAYPIIRKYEINANLMISTGLIENPDYLTWGQLKEMVESGLISAHNHTWSHSNLTSVSQDKLSFEVLTAQKQLQEYLGKTSTTFAYPYGALNNTVVNFLTQNGFASAVSTISGTTQCDSFIMSLHRTRIGNSQLSAYGL